jgi:hypothetical protein
VAVLADLEEYVRQEKSLRGAGPMEVKDFLAQGHRLRRVRGALERLEGRAAIERMRKEVRRSYREVLGDLFQVAATPPKVAGPARDALLRDVDLRRREDLFRLALIANRRFGFRLREVAGMPLYPGES